MNRLTITLGLPPPELAPNARPNRWEEARATRAYREAAALSAVVAFARRPAPHWPAAWVEAAFFFRVRRRRDRDNLLASLKAAFDGLADAGVVENDAGLVHKGVSIGQDAARPRVELTVHPIRAEPSP